MRFCECFCERARRSSECSSTLDTLFGNILFDEKGHEGFSSVLWFDFGGQVQEVPVAKCSFDVVYVSR
jgi:hypothetical protein